MSKPLVFLHIDFKSDALHNTFTHGMLNRHTLVSKMLLPIVGAYYGMEWKEKIGLEWLKY